MKKGIDSKILLGSLIVFCIASLAMASGAKLVSISEDGSLILKAGSNNRGLILVDTASGEETLISNGLGAGNYASISPDNQPHDHRR